MPLVGLKQIVVRKSRTRTTVLATDMAIPISRAAPVSRPNEQPGDCTQYRGHQGLAEGTRYRDFSHCKEVFEFEMEANSEHQQNNANLREVMGRFHVGRQSRDCEGRERFPASRYPTIGDSRNRWVSRPAQEQEPGSLTD